LRKKKEATRILTTYKQVKNKINNKQNKVSKKDKKATQILTSYKQVKKNKQQTK
jgi:hypothetical protein